MATALNAAFSPIWHKSMCLNTIYRPAGVLGISGLVTFGGAAARADESGNRAPALVPGHSALNKVACA